MFNIKNGRVSLDVSCTSNKIDLQVAPDNRGLAPLITTILRSERSIANLHLRHLKLITTEDLENSWMEYYRKRGYKVQKLTPKEVRNELGEWEVKYHRGWY